VSQTDQRAVRAIHAWLMDRFPLAFPKDYDAIHPLKVSILANVIAPMPGFDPVLLRWALANPTRRDGYLLALIHGRGDRRYDLDGQPAGIVTPEERAEAARCQATPKTAPLTTLEIAPLSYSGYSGFRKRGLA
jgi:sRNA-binding protein